jgi:chorismate-pyruvate lyase
MVRLVYRLPAYQLRGSDSLMTAATEHKPDGEISWDDYAQRFSQRPAIELAQLAPVQRMLLTSDGTLTDLLESYLLEPIEVKKLAEHRLWLGGESPLQLEDDGGEVCERRILLKGRTSRRHWLYAESLIVSRRIEERFGFELAATSKPIGRLWAEHRVETFKERIALYSEPAGPLAGYFTITTGEELLCRTYRVLSSGRPVMLITEKFPRSLYL